MTRRHRADRGDEQGFIRWPSAAEVSRAKSSGYHPAMLSDPELIIDRQRLYNYLDSLESLSGE
jgi:hypothetical protein